jgi:hypothetical protein
MAKPVDESSPFSGVTPEQVEKAPIMKPGEKITAITLSGMAMTESGELRKSKYLNILTDTLDDYTDIELTPGEAKKLRSVVTNFQYGSSASIPIMCAGSACPFAYRCPYIAIGKAPLGRACLWELNLLRQWQLNYLEEYQINPENFTEMTIINELVEIELILHRINLSLAKDPEQSAGIVDVSIGFDHNGNPITQKQISQMFELREKLFNRKHKLTKLMVGDRQEKYKKEAALKQREQKDPSSSMSALKEQMESIQRQLASKFQEPIPGKIVSQTEDEVVAEEDQPLNPDDVSADDE